MPEYGSEKARTLTCFTKRSFKIYLFTAHKSKDFIKGTQIQQTNSVLSFIDIFYSQSNFVFNVVYQLGEMNTTRWWGTVVE